MADPVKRLNYFDKQFLREDDFIDEQAYHLQRHREHNRLLHTAGIAEGLEILPSPDLNPTGVTVDVGTAYDKQGREIFLAEKKTLDLENFEKDRSVYIAISYGEEKTDPKSDGGVTGYSRWTETPLVEAFLPNEEDRFPEDSQEKLILAKVNRSGKVVSDIDITERRIAGAEGGDLEVFSLTLKNENVVAEDWSQFRLSGPRQVDMEGSLSINGLQNEIFVSEADNQSIYGLYNDVYYVGGGPVSGLYSQAFNHGDGSVYGLYTKALADSTYPAIGIYATAAGGGTNFAGFFEGNVMVTGDLIGIDTVSKRGGGFLIDHPLDPENKTLYHNFVESPESLCLYRGKTKLNTEGEAVVCLPDYFAALTKEEDATVTLTPIGKKPFPASYEWNSEYTEFTVYGNPGSEVSYIILADRDDPSARAARHPVEANKEKPGELLDPEAYGRPRPRYEQPVFKPKHMATSPMPPEPPAPPEPPSRMGPG